jgi:hypothetical protein
MLGGPIDMFEGDTPQTISNVWPFGFSLIPGRNIAAAYYCKKESRAPKFLYNDSRILTVKCFCDGQFGVFYFVAAGSYWWDTPFIERAHTWSEQTGFNALGNPTFRVIKTHFDLYMGLPNPLRQKDLEHERPPDSGDWAQTGEWLQKYTPHGAYVFNRDMLVSINMDQQMNDDIEPPQLPTTIPLKERTRPPYNQGWIDTNHLAEYGDFLFFNDRHAPVRYDRALTWAMPFETNCRHDDFKFSNSVDHLRSPFTEGGDRVVVGANGVLHVFDDKLGRMDFNAETLTRIS